MVRRRSAPVLFVLLCTALAAPMPAAADRFVATRPGSAVRLLVPHGPLRCSAAGTWVPVGARVARHATIRAITARLMLAGHPVPGARSAWRSPRGIVRDHLHVPSCGVSVEVLYTITARNGHHQRRSFAVGVARPPGRAVLFVGNVEDGTVTLVDERSLSTIRTIDVTPDGKTPQDPGQAAIYPALVQAKGVDYVQGLAVSPDGATLYVSRGYLGDVAAFDIASGALLWRQQIAGVRADHIALSPDGRRLFVSALTANEVQVIDTQTHAIVGQFATGDWPHVLEFSPDGREIVNGSLGNQLLPAGAPTKRQITLADPTTLKVLRTIPFSAGVRPFAFDAAGDRLYVQLSFYNGFVEVDPASGKTLRTVPLPVAGPAVGESPSDYPNQAAHHGIDVSGDDRTICDAATVSNYVALVDRATLATDAIVPVGDQPAEAETSIDGKLCFVADRGPAGNALSVISYADRREIARIPMGHRPQEEAQAFVP